MSTEITTLIWDLDGTLADTLPDLHSSINAALKRVNRPEVSLHNTQMAVGPGKEAFLKAVLPDRDEQTETQFLEIFRTIYWDNCLNKTALFPGIDSVLDRFSDKKLAVATNKPLHYSEKILSGLGARSFFQLIVGPDDVSRAKPYPDMLLKILKHTGSEPSSTLFIGDTIQDLKAGLSAGVPFCRAAYGYGKHFYLEEQNYRSIDKPLDLMDMIPNGKDWKA